MSEKVPSFVSRVLKEPLLYFAIGAIGVVWFLNNRPEVEKERPVIVVDESLIAGLTLAAESGSLGKRGPVDSEQVVARYIRDELLYQQAIKHELYRQVKFRDVLIRDMRQQLAPTVAEPTNEELYQFLIANKEKYHSHPSVSFEHVSWPPDVKPGPDNVLEQLRSGVPTSRFGEPITLANPVPETLLPILKRKFGEEAAESIMSSPEGEWAGPIQSLRGTHYVRVTSRNATGEQPFAKLAPILRRHWMQQQVDEALEQRLRQIAQEYQIEMPDAYQNALP